MQGPVPQPGTKGFRTQAHMKVCWTATEAFAVTELQDLGTQRVRSQEQVHALRKKLLQGWYEVAASLDTNPS